MERLHRLLFELSSPERINVMLALQKNKLKLSQLSRQLKLTVTETSRHLQRLNDAKLIDKNSAGTYELTKFGCLALHMLASLNFLSKHREYFLEYEVSGVPTQFIDRLSELEKSVYMPQAIRNLEEGAQKIHEATKFVWILSDDILTNIIPTLIEKMKTPFDLRIILPEGKFPPET